MFAQPASGGGFFKPRDHENHLILIVRLHGIDKHFDSMKGSEIDRATVDLVDLDGDAELRERVWLTHAGLVNKVSSTGPVLGRIKTVQFSKGAGFSLVPYIEGVDDKKAAAWLAAHPEVSTVPVPAMPTPPPVEFPGAPPRLSLNDMRTVGISSGQVAAAQAASAFSDAPPF